MKNIKKLILITLVISMPLQMAANWTNPYAWVNPHEPNVIAMKVATYCGSAFFIGFLANIASKNTVKQKLVGNGLGVAAAATSAHFLVEPLVKQTVNEAVKPTFGDASYTPPRPQLYVAGSIIGYTVGAVAGTTTRYACSKVYSGIVGAWNWLFGEKKQ